jgi:D-sedoheptulose 7-phosphate isomerase
VDKTLKSEAGTVTPGEVVQALFSASIAAHQKFAVAGALTVAAAAEAISRAVGSGHKVLAFGNGGSAGDAQHFVTELVGRFERQRRALPAVALTADSSVLTAVANDFGYDHVFARQVEALGVPGDVALGISTSGSSRNVERALRTARERGLTSIALTGRDGGIVGRAAEIHVNVSEDSTARVQEVHRTILHGICACLDAQVSSDDAPALGPAVGG